MKSFQSQTFYELLEVSVGATAADVRSAFDRLSRLYSDDQVALYGLIDEARARALRGRLQEAADVLLDDERRARYDASIGLPPREVPRPRPVVPAGPVAPQAGWGGAYTFVTSAPVSTAPPTSMSFTYTVVAPAGAALAPPAPVVARQARAPESPVESAAEVPRPLVERAVKAAPPQGPPEVEPLERAPTAPASGGLLTAAPAVMEAVAQETAPGRVEPAVELQAPGGSTTPAATESANELAPAKRAEAAVESPSPLAPQPSEAPAKVAGPNAPFLEGVSSSATTPPGAEPAATIGAVEAAGGPQGEAVPVMAAPVPPSERHVPSPPDVVAAARVEGPPPSPPDPVGAPVSSPAPVSAVGVAPAERPLTPVSPPDAVSAAAVSAPAVVSAEAPAEQPAAPLGAAAPTSPPEPRAQTSAVTEPVRGQELATAAVEPDAPGALRPIDPPVPDESALVPTRPFTPREYRAPERPRPFEVPAGVEFNGDLLRQVRMARGLSLLQLSERTRIGVRHLENIESDRYDALPALVYLRGMLMNMARELGLDGLRVSKSYLTFVEAHQAKAKG